MKQYDGSKMSVVLAAFLTVLVIGEGPANADYTFGKAQNLGPVINSPLSDFGACESADGLELYFSSERTGGLGGVDIWISTRLTVNDAWSPPTNLGPTVNSPYNEAYPSLSSDGLTLYFSDFYSGTLRPGGLGAGDIWMATRLSRDADWGMVTNLGAPVNSSTLDMSPAISTDGLTLVFTSNNRAGGRGSWDLWMSTRVALQEPWSPPVNLGSTVNSGNWEGECGLLGDGRAVFFGSGRAGIAGATDLWMSTRDTFDDPWNEAVALSPLVNSSSNDGTARVSADGKRFYFCSDRPDGFGSYDLLEAQIIPVVDFNSDYRVDIEDLVILIEHWGQSEPSVDMAPTPFGDGIVDVKDLEVLMSFWGEALDDPHFLAHWKFDETEGDIAHDSAADNDAVVMGDGLWQPDGGCTNGALQLDGTNAHVETPFILNPSDGTFSVFAWIKGGAPGQVILSQAGGATWLGTDESGNLFTDLKGAGRNKGKSLYSNTVVTDGLWHRIGLVWDLSCRSLYLDDELVVMDTAPQTNFSSVTGGFWLGAQDTTGQGTFWSGMIDDVRIYDRVVEP